MSYNATLTAEARMMLGFLFTTGPRYWPGPQSPVLSDTEPRAVRDSDIRLLDGDIRGVFFVIFISA